MKKIILVVCKGNIHRSVIAEICIREKIEKLGLGNEFEVASRGLQGTCQTDIPRFPNIKEYELEWKYTEPILQEMGIEISDDRKSTPVDRDIVKMSSLISLVKYIPILFK